MLGNVRLPHVLHQYAHMGVRGKTFHEYTRGWGWPFLSESFWMCCQRLSILLCQNNISKIRIRPIHLYTYTSTNGKWTFHACSSKTLTVKFKVQTKQFFQDIVLLQMLSWPCPVYCSWSLRLHLYGHILNSQTFRSASGRSLPHSNLRPPQSWQSLRPHHSLELQPRPAESGKWRKCNSRKFLTVQKWILSKRLHRQGF